MKRRIAALAAGLALITLSTAGAAGEFVSAAGNYHWNLAASHYETPPYAKEQTMAVAHDDGKTIKFSQAVLLADGKTVNWSFDGAYDGKPHPGNWITVALTRIAPDAFANDYTMSDGTRGHEVATITANRIVIKGAATDPKGVKQSYEEVWDKMK